MKYFTGNSFKWTLAVMVLIFTLIGACKHEPVLLTIDEDPNDPTDPVDTTGTNPQIDPCDPDTVYFENTILPLIISNCAKSGCHDAASHQDGVVLIDYFTIMSSGDIQPFDPSDSELYEVITENDPDKRMPPPPASRLTNEQISLIATWINQGAQNNGCAECDTSDVTFTQNIKPIVDLKCKGCHSGATPTGGINLETHAGVYAVAISGQMLGAVRHQQGYPSMPPSGGMIPQCEIDQIQIWINEGALNN